MRFGLWGAGCGRFEVGPAPDQVWAFERVQERGLEKQEKGGNWGSRASGTRGARTPIRSGDINR